MKRIHFAVSLLLLCHSAMALDVGDISSFIPSEQSQLSKEIKNTTDSGRLVNIKIERISSPLDSGTAIPMATPDEILLTPASMVLPANAKDVVRFYYKGPSDDQERYYRIIWFDQALSEAGQNSSKRNAVATTSARIGTILVVSPRQDKFNYQYNHGSIKNTGNSTFKLVSYGPCRDQKTANDCKENYFLMPGKERTLSKVNTEDKKGHVGLWHGELFIPVK